MSLTSFRIKTTFFELRSAGETCNSIGIQSYFTTLLPFALEKQFYRIISYLFESWTRPFQWSWNTFLDIDGLLNSVETVHSNKTWNCFKWFLWIVSITEWANFVFTAETHITTAVKMLYHWVKTVLFFVFFLVMRSLFDIPLRLKLCPIYIIMKSSIVIITICFSTVLETQYRMLVFWIVFCFQ